MLEPYAPNILRVTLSMDDAAAKSAPGYGIIGKSDASGLERRARPNGQDVYKSSGMTVTVQHASGPAPTKLFGTTGTSVFFRGSAPWASIRFSTADGKKLVDMNGWGQAVYNHKDGTAPLANDFRPSDPPSFVVSASFRHVTTSTTTDWARTSRAFSTIAATQCCCQKHDYLPRRRPACACRSC